jgi:hypothetical protein
LDRTSTNRLAALGCRCPRGCTVAAAAPAHCPARPTGRPAGGPRTRRESVPRIDYRASRVRVWLRCVLRVASGR